MAAFVETVLRPKDLLHVQFEFVNLKLDETVAASPVLKRAAAGPAFIVLRLPPQHVAEEAFNAGDAPLPPYKACLACPSRIAFKLPDGTGPIAFTLDAILGLIAKLPPLPPAGPPGAGPATLIEFPDRLLLVPEAAARLFHRAGLSPAGSSPTSDAEWIELWHTRLGSDGPSGKGRTRFGAVSNPVDLDDRLPNAPLTRRHRLEIVARCSNPSSPLIASSQFILTPLGATAQLKSGWPPAASFLKAWEQEAVTGRDRFVRIEEQGFLYPFGHRASLQTIVERDFYALNGSVLIGGLRKHTFVAIEEAERRYEELHHVYEFGGREMPLKQIRIVSQPASLPAGHAPIPCSVNATDDSGNVIACDLTMFFLTQSEAVTDGALNDVHNRYLAHNTTAFRPQRVSLAKDDERRGDTTLTVTGFTFKVRRLPLNGSVQPPFVPAMQSAEVSIPAVEQLLGTVAGRADVTGAATAARSGAPARTLTLHDNYLRRGFPSDDDKQVFAMFAPAMPEFSVPAERAGGLTAPTFKPMDGLSRVRGLVADVRAFAGDQGIDPARLIGEAKLLGVIALKEIIDAVRDNVPAVRPEDLFDTIDRPEVFATRPVLTTVQTDAGVEVRFLWKPKIKGTGLPAPLITIPPGSMALIVKGRIRKSADTRADKAFEVDGKLLNFGLAFGDLLTVKFTHVTFTSGGGRKMEVKPAIKEIEFGKGLAFLEKIRALLPTSRLGDAPGVRPQADGVVVSFAIGIPSLSVGVLSFQNIAVISSISLPFVEKPAALRFTLSERSHPFLVSVSIFGGTGFFALEIRTDKSVQIEAAIEFGGVVSINLLGIVSGGVYVFVGIFVSVDSHGEVAVSGHLRLGGYVDVAGLITVSIEVYLALTYRTTEKVLKAEGRLTISVKVLFFSLSQTFVITRRIAGFGEPPAAGLIAEPSLPDFTTTMSRLQWEEYCKAFA